ncbi:MAG TPA: YihY/virulence factor BrkB family protein [Kofleriaceae bacterium]|nr:YihY/virulence factor BrkB family protein [Kofleriaceae bacterium]
MAVKLVRQWSHWVRTSETVLARWLRAAHAALLGEMPILAAGTALFAILAIVPTLAAAVAIYGLVADPTKIQPQIENLQHVLPVEVVHFIGLQLKRQASRGSGELSLQLVTSIVLAVFSSRASARSLIDALNRAYRVRERRKPIVRLGLSVTMALSTLIGIITMFAVLIVLPALVGAINRNWIPIAMLLRWPALLAIVFLTLLALYRYGPSPRPLGPEKHTDAGGVVGLPPAPLRHICLPGAVIATCLLLLVSYGLSVYVDYVSSSELIRGAFGSVIVTLLWFYLSTIALVIGGFVNAELERHRGAPEPERSMY